MVSCAGEASLCIGHFGSQPGDATPAFMDAATAADGEGPGQERQRCDDRHGEGRDRQVEDQSHGARRVTGRTIGRCAWAG